MYKGHKVVAVIPARAGSKRIPHKNTVLLGGKPLIWYTLQAACQCPILDLVAVSTDDTSVKKVALEVGVEVIPRPRELAQDDTPTWQVLKHALGVMKLAGDYVLVLLQPTSPLRTAEDISETVRKMVDNVADSAESVVVAPPPEYMFKCDGDGWALPLHPRALTKPRSSLLSCYLQNGAVFAMTLATFESGRLQGDRHQLHIMPPERSVDIDTDIDIKLAEVLISDGKN